MNLRRVAAIVAMGAAAVGLAAASPTPVDAQSRCTTDTYNTPDDAKLGYGDDCGRPFEDTPEFRCDWVPGGWQCSGPGQSTGQSDQEDAPSDQDPDAAETDAAQTDAAETDAQDAVERLEPPRNLRYTTDRSFLLRLRSYLHWDAVDGAAKYNVYLDGEYAETVTGTRVRVSSRQRRTYEVVAVDADGTVFSPKSQPLITDGSRTQGELDELAAPAHLLATTEPGSVTLTWDRVEFAEGYDIYVNGTYARTVSGRTATFHGPRAKYEVVAWIKLSNGGHTHSPKSAPVVVSSVKRGTVFAKDASGPNNAPELVLAAHTNDGDLLLAWEHADSVEADHYRIFRNGRQIASTRDKHFVDVGWTPTSVYHVAAADGRDLDLTSPVIAPVEAGSPSVVVTAADDATQYAITHEYQDVLEEISQFDDASAIWNTYQALSDLPGTIGGWALGTFGPDELPDAIPEFEGERGPTFFTPQAVELNWVMANLGSPLTVGSYEMPPSNGNPAANLPNTALYEQLELQRKLINESADAVAEARQIVNGRLTPSVLREVLEQELRHAAYGGLDVEDTRGQDCNSLDCETPVYSFNPSDNSGGSQNSITIDPDTGEVIPEPGNTHDLDGNGIPDVVDPDIDGDGTPNALDQEPLNAENSAVDVTDTDGDGIRDVIDLDDDDDGTGDAVDIDPKDPTRSEVDGNGNGIPDSEEKGGEDTDPFNVLNPTWKPDPACSGSLDAAESCG